MASRLALDRWLKEERCRCFPSDHMDQQLRPMYLYKDHEGYFKLVRSYS